MTYLRKTYSAEHFLREHCPWPTYGLIAGCGSATRPLGFWVTADVNPVHQPDYLADLHDPLPGDPTPFDRIICNAVLQYCHTPSRVVRNLADALTPNGLLYLEVPFVQQVCVDAGGDRFRFTLDGLRGLVTDAGLTIVASGPTIRPGSALAWLAEEVVSHTAQNRYVRHGLALLTRVLAFPLHFLPSIAPERAAGGCYVIARRN